LKKLKKKKTVRQEESHFSLCLRKYQKRLTAPPMEEEQKMIKKP